LEELIVLLAPEEPMKNLSIAQIGTPILRETAQPVVFPLTPDVQKLIEDLIWTARDSNGVGIAAPQVAESLRLMIVASRPTPRYPYAPTMEPTAMLNPQIVDRSQEEARDWEGCLSVPGVRGLVQRATWIEVEYWDRAGNLQRVRLEGFVARIFQHEYDHLEGILFVDRVAPADLISEEAYQRIAFDPLPSA
jgi:peptide deformylase